MSSLITRSVVLAFSRVTNYGILIISPIFLVRLLDVEQFGQYREFLLYATLLSSVLGFAINKSLLYFLPKFPLEQHLYITQASLFAFAFCAIGIGLLFLAKGLLLAVISFDFIIPLALYLLFFLNLDFVEAYALAKKRADYVLYYSSIRLLIRISVVVVTAYYTRNVVAIIYSIIVVEALRFVLVFSFALKRRLITGAVRWPALRKQMYFFVPLGLAALIGVHINMNLGALFISTNLGVTALAFYVVATYVLFVTNLFRGSISDVIFPEMASMATSEPRVALRLWQRATVLYCFFIFPIALTLFYYADVFIETVFTEAYLPGVPVFKIYLLFVVRECFDVELALRVMNRNSYFLVGNLFMLFLNVGLMFVLFHWLGLVGPALAFVIANVVAAIYLGRQVMRFSELSLRELFPWNQIGMILVGCILGLPILWVGEYVEVNDVVRAIVFSGLYGLFYLIFVGYTGVGEVSVLRQRLLKGFSRY